MGRRRPGVLRVSLIDAPEEPESLTTATSRDDTDTVFVHKPCAAVPCFKQAHKCDQGGRHQRTANPTTGLWAAKSHQQPHYREQC